MRIYYVYIRCYVYIISDHMHQYNIWKSSNREYKNDN